MQAQLSMLNLPNLSGIYLNAVFWNFQTTELELGLLKAWERFMSMATMSCSYIIYLTISLQFLSKNIFVFFSHQPVFPIET